MFLTEEEVRRTTEQKLVKQILEEIRDIYFPLKRSGEKADWGQIQTQVITGHGIHGEAQMSYFKSKVSQLRAAEAAQRKSRKAHKN